VRATPNLSDFSSKQGAITLGNGAADSVSLDNSQGDTVTLGDGAFDSVDIAGFFPSSGNTTGNFGEETDTNFNAQHVNIVLAQAMFAKPAPCRAI
jgi:hypothetical protein